MTIDVSDFADPAPVTADEFSIKIRISDSLFLVGPTLKFTVNPCGNEILDNTVNETQNYEFILGDINPIHLI